MDENKVLDLSNERIYDLEMWYLDCVDYSEIDYRLSDEQRNVARENNLKLEKEKNRLVELELKKCLVL